jgi:ATP-dependent helicase YprA (DUF1998 family)
LSLQEILARIKDGRLKFVVATELAARGLDIPDLTHVVNFELPTDPQHYVHRSVGISCPAFPPWSVLYPSPCLLYLHSSP